MKFIDAKKYLTEAYDSSHLTSGPHHEVAKQGYDKLADGSKTTGSFKGNVRRYFNHVGGELERTMYGDHDHRSYSSPSRTSGSGHYFAMKYKPGKNSEPIYSHVKFPRNFDLSDQDKMEAEIKKQNPHLEKTGHPSVLASHIKNYHGKK